LFVAVSVNIERILGNSGLPERALQTLLLLLAAMIVSITVLIPGQPHTALGVELLALGLMLTASVALLMRKTLPSLPEHVPVGSHLLLLVPGTMPLIFGAVSLLVSFGGGLYWIAGGLLGAIPGASINAWVLLVEILR
jgi:modulator of FtsH protease